MILRDDTRQVIRFLLGVLVAVIVLFFGSIFVFYKAGSTSRTHDKTMLNVAKQKTPIVQVDRYYHLNRGTNSYALAGKSNKKVSYYFVYLPKSKKAFLYEAKKGFTQTEIIDKFKKSYRNKSISSINFGWYQGNPVWEITYKNSNHKLGYVMYNFKNGIEINKVDNL